jgi:hypothetical protein
VKNRLCRNLLHLSHLDIPGGGQVVVDGDYAYVGHMAPPHGTSIIDVRDPTHPAVVATIDVDARSHSHKVRVAGDIMVTNVEQHRRHLLRRGERLDVVGRELAAELGRQPTDAELARGLGVAVGDLEPIREHLENGYHDGGFRVWDIADRGNPRQLHEQRTFGFGTHRFDLDDRYAYISTEMEGYIGNILVIYDLAEPSAPVEVSRWWMPGQHLAGGEQPHWQGYSHRLHHALRHGDQLWAAVWHAGLRVIEIGDIARPRTIGEFDYHPWTAEPTHTVLPLDQAINGRRIAVACDEEHEHRHGQPHAGLWILDVSDPAAIRPLATFHVSEMDSPWARAPGRFGMHQFAEHLERPLVFCAWFSGGLRVVDISDPERPVESGFYIPEPPTGFASPQSNDVDTDDRGLVYLLDRNRGLDILEYDP